MVLGHENCGAVEAAVKHVKEAHITSILKEIEPAVKMARHQQGDVLDNAVRNNVFLVVDALKNSNPIISKHIKNGDVKIVGAYYDLDTGRVEIIK